MPVYLYAKSMHMGIHHQVFPVFTHTGDSNMGEHKENMRITQVIYVNMLKLVKIRCPQTLETRQYMLSLCFSDS